MSSFKYPRDMIEPLKAQWYEWARREWDPPPLPSDDVLGLLFEVAYHASFTADERRGTHFTAIICGRNESDLGRPFPIEPPRKFTPHEVMRLAPAAHAAKSVLAVDPSGSEPVIWGFCAGADMQLTVSAMAPGSLHVGRNGRVIVALEDGHLYAEGERLGVFQPIIEALSEATEALWEGIDFTPATWSPKVLYPGYLYDILNTVRQDGHGGAILVIPDGEWDSASWRALVRIKYQCQDDSIWPLLRKSVFQYDEAYRKGSDSELGRVEYAEAEAKALLGRLSGLTAVDGALLITDRYRVLGFGVEVLAHAELEAIFLADGTSRSVEAYGTRHRSAFRFCAAYPRGAAFVCSQDGAIKCIRNQGGRVTIYQ
jgi:hypothetical protein